MGVASVSNESIGSKLTSLKRKRHGGRVETWHNSLLGITDDVSYTKRKYQLHVYKYIQERRTEILMTFLWEHDSLICCILGPFIHTQNSLTYGITERESEASENNTTFFLQAKQQQEKQQKQQQQQQQQQQAQQQTVKVQQQEQQQQQQPQQPVQQQQQPQITTACQAQQLIAQAGGVLTPPQLQ